MKTAARLRLRGYVGALGLLGSMATAGCVDSGVETSQGEFAVKSGENHDKGAVTLKDVRIQPPSGWRVQQQTRSGDTSIAGFAKGEDYVTFYANPNLALEMKEIFGQQAQVIQEISAEQYGGLFWQTME